MRSLMRSSFGVVVLALFCEACCSSRPHPPCTSPTPPQPQDQVVRATPQKSILRLRGGAYLDGLHPELIKRARLLYERAEREEISLRFISGYRKYRKNEKRMKARVKANRSVASWHNFGAAFDVNLTRYKGMKQALKHYDKDEATWKRIGVLARELGLTWGAPWGREEIFHFEWHPGHPDALRLPDFEKLTAVTGAQVRDYQKAWKLFKVK